MALTRRQFAGAACGAPALVSVPRTPRVYRGVELGVQSWCFNDRPFEQMVRSVSEVGATSLEMWSGHLEPLRKFRGQREDLRAWRLAADMDRFRDARGKLDEAGIHLSAFNISIRNDWTDEEIDRAFQMARALGTDLITSSSNVSTAARIDPVAVRYRTRVGFHNHARIRPDEFATPEDFRSGLEGCSEFLGINLDTGHFTAAGLDPLEFTRRNHNRIYSLHMKDRTENDGPKVPFGEGATPLRAILRLLQRSGWSIPANVEFAYPAEDRVAETRKNFEWMKRVLEA